MSEVFIRIQEDSGLSKVFGESPAGTERELKDAVDDIADRIEEYAKTLAPEGETGELKEHPVDRTDSRGIAAQIEAFGGGFSVRGESGRFVKGIGLVPGKTVTHIEITVAKEPTHAIWVHQGTGIFGPHGTPIVSPSGRLMVFEIDGRKFRRRSVLGQVAQPYLTDAFEFIDRTFVPRRVEQLRLEIAASFK